MYSESRSGAWKECMTGVRDRPYVWYTSAPVRVLLWNLNYCSGLTGAPLRYMSGALRYFLPYGKERKRVRDAVLALIAQEHPDVCFFLEVHKSTSFLDGFPQFPVRRMDNKYDVGGVFSTLPFLSRNTNAAFAVDGTCRAHFLPCGMKRLVHTVDLSNGFTLLACHLSLRRHLRQAQLQALAKIVAGKPRTILCGDFNIRGGIREFDAFVAATEFRLSLPPGPTFPAIRPSCTWDLFLHSSDLVVRQCTIPFTEPISDHLPVLLEVHGT